MKTPEEIENLAWKFYVEKDGIVPNMYEREGFTYGYTQCQQDNHEKIESLKQDVIGYKRDLKLLREYVERIKNNIQ